MGRKYENEISMRVNLMIYPYFVCSLIMQNMEIDSSKFL